MKLEGVAAVVTGGASGLGEATARALAALGVKVALFDLNEEGGEQLAREIGGVFCRVDVTDDGSVDAGFEKARAAHGQERILINCAGTGNAIKTASRDRNTGEIKHFPLDSFNKIVQINLVGTFRCIAKSAAGMLTLEPQADGERGSIGLYGLNSGWKLNLWGRNLLDEYYWTSVSSNANLAVRFAGKPRTFGLNLSMSY